MKWKKFLYRQACEAEGGTPCPARGCDGCVDRPGCFVGEDGVMGAWPPPP